VNIVEGGKLSSSPKISEQYGPLIYFPPPYSHIKRTISASLILLSIIIPLLIFGRYIQIRAWNNLATYQNIFLIVSLVLISFYQYLFLSYIADRILYPKFKIYENGITRFVTPIFTNREGEFIPFSDMKSFSISKDKKTCAVILHNNEFPVIWTSYDPKHIIPIVGALRKHNIPETD